MSGFAAVGQDVRMRVCFAGPVLMDGVQRPGASVRAFATSPTLPSWIMACVSLGDKIEQAPACRRVRRDAEQPPGMTINTMFGPASFRCGPRQGGIPSALWRRSPA